jgi:DNA-binding beta-propeller fold protein YncE
VLENVNMYGARGYADLDVTPSGTAVYVPATVSNRPERSLFWMDAAGALQTLNAEPGALGAPRVSPDGTRIALVLDGNVAVFDPSTRRMTRLTFLKVFVQSPLCGLGQ